VALSDPQFWIALLQIIGVNIVLSWDNAVIACCEAIVATAIGRSGRMPLPCAVS
jgi:predicted tellurium resistance membrane protein TerC